MCNAYQHPPGCNCGFGGGTGGGFRRTSFRAPAPKVRGWRDDEAVTYLTECWECGQPVYFYRNEFGGCALFEDLGWPWEIHPCWEIHRDRHQTIIRSYRSKLRGDSLSANRSSWQPKLRRSPSRGRTTEVVGGRIVSVRPPPETSGKSNLTTTPKASP